MPANDKTATMTSTTKPKSIYPSYLAPIDLFLQQDDSPGYPMTFVIRMECEGIFDHSAFQTALDGSLERHPLLRAFVRPAKQNKPCWVANKIDGKLVPPPVDWADSDTPIVCDPEGFDLSKETGLRIWVREDQTDNKTLVVFQFQHATTDGTGAFRFIGDMLALYDQALGGTETRLLDLDPQLLRERRRRMAKAYVSGKVTAMWAAGWRQFKSVFLRRAAELAAPASGPAMPFPGILIHTFDREQTAALRAAADTAGVMLNDLLLSQLFHTMRDWNRQQNGRDASAPLRILMPTDLRGSSEHEMPAANFVAYTFLVRKAKACDDAKELLESIGRETAQIKYATAGTDFIDAISGAESTPWLVPWMLRRSRCLATAVLTNNGDPARRMTAKIKRKAGRLITGSSEHEIVVTRFSGVPPLRPKTRAAVCAMIYAKQLTISLRGDPVMFREEDSQALLERYVKSLSDACEEQENTDAAD